MLFSLSTIVYAKDNVFHSPYFDISLTNSLNLISKTEDPKNGFYRYVFASSNSNNAALQMRVIVSSKKPSENQSLEDFQTDAIGHMSALFMDSYGLYQYISKPENQKVLSSKPNQLKLGNKTFAEATLYFGNIDVSFLVTNSDNMTYAFTLISKDDNEQIRKKNLQMLIRQLQSIKFNQS